MKLGNAAGTHSRLLSRRYTEAHFYAVILNEVKNLFFLAKIQTA